MTVTTADLHRDAHTVWHVPPHGAVDYPTAELPVPPKVVGEMLGEQWRAGRENPVPGEYLLGDLQQRHELLEGISVGMDCLPEFRCGPVRVHQGTFPVSVLPGMRMLLSSLGARVSVDVTGGIATITCTTGAAPQAQEILRVTPVSSVPVRCIQVEAEDKLYLAGHGFHATHNTTVLNALSEFIPPHERIVTIEDSLELRLHPDRHVAALEARPPDATGSNAVPIRLLVRNALRMRPDRIVVGEIRDAAAVDMLQACNTGHEGSMSTLHANGPNEALSRLHVMIAQGGEIPTEKIDWLIADAIDLIVQVRRYEDGSRRVSGIHELLRAPNGALSTSTIWEWQHTGTTDGRLHGEHTKVSSLSDTLRRKLRLDTLAPSPWVEVFRTSQITPRDGR